MGGPISLLLAHRHPELVKGVVVQATALEWRAHWWERWQWKSVRVMGTFMRSRLAARLMDKQMKRLLGPDHPMLPYLPWMACEFNRNEVLQLVNAGRSLGQYDAREFAPQLGVPAASLITTRDRLVRPSKQRALAGALNAHIIEVADDHLVSLTSPDTFAKVTVELVQHVNR
jgi:3-oxoadipate enol-lactonase